MAPKTITIRPNPEDSKIVIALRKKLGLNPTGLFRQALRLLAAKEKVRV
jgi:hypothetical protein